ncbi:MAG: hypothetical protein ACXVB1_06410 [Pseudobdellovibrionaceae bacterium]
MRLYLRLLSSFYFIGFLLHLADFLDLRLKFSEMPLGWKAWIVYLGVMDLFAALGLWYKHKIGIILFFIIAISQLIAYLIFRDYFGDQISLIFFHLVTIGIYLTLLKYENPRIKLSKS